MTPLFLSLPPLLSLVLDAAFRSLVLTAVVAGLLGALRVRTPQVAMAAWGAVLLSGLAMPLLVHLAPAGSLALPPGLYRAYRLWTSDGAGDDPAAAAVLRSLMPAVPVVAPRPSWGFVALIIYAAGTAGLLLRLGMGLLLSWRLARAATPVLADWTAGHDVRISPALTVPVSVGGRILLPPAATGWDAACRRAVLAHEASHIGRGDFYTLLLASLYRALFWFSPAAWWLNNRLADLAEASSDAAALATMEDRLSYAQILLDLAGAGRTTPLAAAGVAMARPSTVTRRVDRILAGRLPLAMVSPRRALAMAATVLPLALAAAGASADGRVGDTPDQIAARRAEQALPRTAIAMAPPAYDKFTGYYDLPFSPDRPLKVYRDGDRLMAGVIGQPAMEVLPESSHKFFAKGLPVQGDFIFDVQGRVAGLVLHQDGYLMPARRLDRRVGEALEEALRRHVAANLPQPGSEAALRTHIIQVQAGHIDPATISGAKADAITRMLPQTQPELSALGPIEQVEFRGVGPDGMDVYWVTHAKGRREWRIALDDSGKITAMWFKPIP